MNKLFACIVFAAAVVLPMTASAQSAQNCRKTQSTCIEGPETRDIAGAQIFKECWRYTHKFECVEESIHDTCAPLKTAPGCLQTGSVCKTRAFNGECLVFTNTFTCDAKQQPLPEGIVQVGESFTIVKDEIAAEQCRALSSNPQCQKTTSVCTEPGGTRIIDGQSVTKDCWAWEETYACVTLQTDCRDFSENSACKLVHQNCESPNPDGTCALKALTYSCATGTSGPTEVTTCNGGKFCLNGLCFDQPAGNDRDFAMAMTMMEAGRQAAGYAQGQDLVKFFTGEAKDCSKTAFANCCRTNTKGAGMTNGAMISTVMQAGRQAWGSWYVYDALHSTTRSTNALGALYSRFALADGSWSNFATGDFFSGFSYYGVTFNPLAVQPFAFDPTSFAISIAMQLLSELLACEQEEEVLAMARGQNLCAYVGSYCTQKFLGSCVSRKSSYCCFNSRLARMIQEQGRQQLGMSWGTAEAPQCKGLTEDQFKQIDFSTMDFSELVDDINANVKLPDMTNVQTKNEQTINQKVQNYFAK